MKSIFKILMLGVVPILAATAVVDQGLAADKGSQLIFQSNMAHTNYISIVNAAPDGEKAVTVLVQYYNNEMEMVVWYLRVIPHGTNVLVDPFNHMIPGSDPATNVGDAIMASGKAGNGHFVIAVTAVGTNVAVDTTPEVDDDPMPNAANTVNVLFPIFLAEDLHGTNNIDNCGVLTVAEDPTADEATNNLTYTKNGDNDCADGTEAGVDEADMTSKNVGGLSVDNAQPVSFNHLTGSFTEALRSTAAGGADQTASWGGTPVVRPAVDDPANTTPLGDYRTLNGMNPTGTPLMGGRLAEKDAAGKEVNTHGDAEHEVSGFLNTGSNHPDGTNVDLTDANVLTAAEMGGKIEDGFRHQRGLNDGALVLPALYGGGDMAHQIMLLLSVADDFGGPGKYELIPAMTGIDVVLTDPMGNELDMEDAADDQVFGGGAEDPDADVASARIIVNGVQVMIDADLDKCTGTMIDGPWSLAHLTSLVPEASAGGKEFAGLDAMLDEMVTSSPGWIKFARKALTCEKDYGDGDSANLEGVETADGVPVSDLRTFTGGTLIVEEKSQNRAFVTTGRALLKFITPDATFAASWTLKSPPSPMRDDEASPATETGNVDPDTSN